MIIDLIVLITWIALLTSGIRTFRILKTDQDPEKLKKSSGSRNPKTARVLATIMIALGTVGIFYCAVLILRTLAVM